MAAPVIAELNKIVTINGVVLTWSLFFLSLFNQKIIQSAKYFMLKMGISLRKQRPVELGVLHLLFHRMLIFTTGICQGIPINSLSVNRKQLLNTSIKIKHLCQQKT